MLEAMARSAPSQPNEAMARIAPRSPVVPMANNKNFWDLAAWWWCLVENTKKNETAGEMYYCGGAEESKGSVGDAAFTVAHAVKVGGD
jgi:hypothetical protein